MSQGQEVKAGEKIIAFCPFCGVGYTESGALNVEISCPEGAGCGSTFLVKKL